MFVAQGVSPGAEKPDGFCPPLHVPPPLAAERGGERGGSALLAPGLTPWATHIPPRWG